MYMKRFQEIVFKIFGISFFVGVGIGLLGLFVFESYTMIGIGSVCMLVCSLLYYGVKFIKWLSGGSSK